VPRLEGVKYLANIIIGAASNVAENGYFLEFVEDEVLKKC